MRRVIPWLTALGLLLTAPFARADTFWDVSAGDAAKLQEALHKGDVLVRMCPGCGGQAVVFELKSLTVAPGDYSDGHQLKMRWRGVASGQVGRELAVPAVDCVQHTNLCLQDIGHDCAGPVANLDVPYTFVLRDGAWVWVGALAGLQPPGTAWERPFPATRSQERAVRQCKRVRSLTAHDHGATLPDPRRPPPPPGRRR